MKKILLTIELVFEGEVTGDEELQELTENVARAVVNETNGIGIAPQASDTYLTEVTVFNTTLGVETTQKVF